MVKMNKNDIDHLGNRRIRSVGEIGWKRNSVFGLVRGWASWLKNV